MKGLKRLKVTIFIEDGHIFRADDNTITGTEKWIKWVCPFCGDPRNTNWSDEKCKCGAKLEIEAKQGEWQRLE